MDYKKLDCSVSLKEANWRSLLITLPMVSLLGLAYVGMWGIDRPWSEFAAVFSSFGRLVVSELLLLGLLGLGILVHEGIHAVCWVWGGKKSWQAVQVGFDRRTLTPYVHCREPLPIGVYRLGALTPGVLTGLLPWLVGLVSGNLLLALVGLLLIVGAGGDLLVLWLTRHVASDCFVEDHPSRAGCYVLQPGAPTV